MDIKNLKLEPLIFIDKYDSDFIPFMKKYPIWSSNNITGIGFIWYPKYETGNVMLQGTLLDGPVWFPTSVIIP